MKVDLPAAVPEVPVNNIAEAAAYYANRLGFTLDWGGDGSDIAGISREECRLFLTNPAFRETRGNSAPVVIWINLGSRAEVDELHRDWSAKGAEIAAPPESKPWKLHEFVAADPDGNKLRVFYDFAWETAEAS
ncbi:MAG: bleomycin resistance family protein [Bradyrhizobium sp.]|nr:bleomycin resistance family protein [Bradyrhizobium sp.]